MSKRSTENSLAATPPLTKKARKTILKSPAATPPLTKKGKWSTPDPTPDSTPSRSSSSGSVSSENGDSVAPTNSGMVIRPNDSGVAFRTTDTAPVLNSVKADLTKKQKKEFQTWFK